MKNIKSVIFCVTTILFLLPGFAGADETDSPYRKAGNFIFISSQPPVDPATHQIISGDVDQQVKQAFDNLRNRVIESGAQMSDVIKLTIYMDDIDVVFPVVKEYIPKYFTAPYPARSPVAGLSFGRAGFKVAIDAIVYIEHGNY